MPGTDYVLAINVHICRSVVPGRAGGHVPGMSAAYENQALLARFLRFLLGKNHFRLVWLINLFNRLQTRLKKHFVVMSRDCSSLLRPRYQPKPAAVETVDSNIELALVLFCDIS